jgi:hypothetical protein
LIKPFLLTFEDLTSNLATKICCKNDYVEVNSGVEKETIFRSPTFKWGGFSCQKSLRQNFISILLNMLEILTFLLSSSNQVGARVLVLWFIICCFCKHESWGSGLAAQAHLRK